MLRLSSLALITAAALTPLSAVAEGDSGFYVSGFIGAGFYHDDYRRTADGWRFHTGGMHTNSAGEGWAIFVVDYDQTFYAGPHVVNEFHHSSFLAGGPDHHVIDISGAGTIAMPSSLPPGWGAVTNARFGRSLAELLRLWSRSLTSSHPKGRCCRRTRRPASRRPSNACALVTSWTK